MRSPVFSLPFWGLAIITPALLFSACQSETSGECCRAIKPEAEQFIPKPDPDQTGAPSDVIRQDPAFDCDELTCVSHQGSEAFCTRRCPKDDCPEGFVCTEILQADYCDDSMMTMSTDDDCQPGAIRPSDRFCVRKPCSANSDCPDGFTCVTTHEGTGTSDNPTIKQCVKSSHMCAS